MIQKTGLSQRQFMLLLVALLTATSLINLPHSLVQMSKGDAPFTLAFGLVYALLFASYLVWLSAKYPKKNLFQIHEIVLGRIGGTLINLLLLLHIFFVLMRNVRLFNFFAKVVMLPRTPTEIMLLLFFLVLIYYGSSTIEVPARVNELAFPIQLIGVIAMPFMLISQFSTFASEPLFVNRLSNVSIAGLTNCTWFGDIVVMGAFIQTIASKVELKSALRLGVVLSTCILCLFLVLMVLVYGPHITENQVYPAFSLSMQIFLTDFMDRMEMIFIMIFFPFYFVNTALVFISMLLGVATVTRSRDYTQFSPSFGLLMLLCSLYAFRGSIDVNVFANYGFPFFVLCIEPPAVLLVILATVITERKAQAEGSAVKGADAEIQAGETENAGRPALHSAPSPQNRKDEQDSSASSDQGQQEQENQRQSQQQQQAEQNGSSDSNGDRQGKDHRQPEQGEPNPQRKRPNGSSGSAPKKAPWSRKRWAQITNGLVAIACLFIVVGFATGLDYQPVAAGCALGYLVSLALCLYSAIRECKRARIESVNT
ncbi:GerAB/ArcD/ProY family transporter [Gorillibacterium sp. sgz500922]|uniref:GerAB/ArcD/ProY family transporter n=1 Tax=Gorillibacterium sp. sgz500922 TaxID=3446694 RepID=UPI003F66D3CE